MQPLDESDQQIVDAIPDLPRVKVSPAFKSEVMARIRESESSRVVSSPWRRTKPWVIAVLAHAAVLALVANIYLSSGDRGSGGESLRTILYNQRLQAAETAQVVPVSEEGSVLFAEGKPGSLLRLVPLKECVGIFNYRQWQSLAAVTRTAYESEKGFTERTLSRQREMTLSEFHKKSYFDTSQKATILSFVDRTEIWNSQTLASYLDEYPVEIERASIFGF